MTQLRLAHLTDLHFGEAMPELAGSLAQDVLDSAPDAILVSGDLTRRAESGEFAAAWRFMASLGAPVLAVPGNHDIPPRNLFQRFFQPRRRWQRGLPVDAVQELALPGLTVIGLDTVRRAHWHLDWSAGGVSASRRADLRARLRQRREPRCLLVCHHPLRHPLALQWRRLPAGADRLLDLLREEGVEAVLSGHLHMAAVLRGMAGEPVQLITPSGLSARGSGALGWSLITPTASGLDIHSRHYRDGAWGPGAITRLGAVAPGQSAT